MSMITVLEMAEILEAADYVLLVGAGEGPAVVASAHGWDGEDDDQCYIIGRGDDDIRLLPDDPVNRRGNGGFTFTGFVGTVYAVNRVTE